MVGRHGRHGMQQEIVEIGAQGEPGQRHAKSGATVRRQEQRRRRHAFDRGLDRACREEPRKAQRGCGKAHRSQAGYHKVAQAARSHADAMAHAHRAQGAQVEPHAAADQVNFGSDAEGARSPPSQGHGATSSRSPARSPGPRAC